MLKGSPHGGTIEPDFGFEVSDATYVDWLLAGGDPLIAPSVRSWQETEPAALEELNYINDETKPC